MTLQESRQAGLKLSQKWFLTSLLFCFQLHKFAYYYQIILVLCIFVNLVICNIVIQKPVIPKVIFIRQSWRLFEKLQE